MKSATCTSEVKVGYQKWSMFNFTGLLQGKIASTQLIWAKTQIFLLDTYSNFHTAPYINDSDSDSANLKFVIDASYIHTYT